MNRSVESAGFSHSTMARAGERRAGARAGSSAASAEPYYGIPYLKRPTWKWQIAAYFFFGGISGASFALASLADHFSASPDAAALRRAGFETSLAALLPCPGLLIWDLGRPVRFPYMLRVWKPGSPMNLGSWILTGFGAVSALGAVHAAGQAGVLGPLSPLARHLPMHAIGAAGLPLALGMTGYTGVLLAGTSVPAWNQSPWMGGVFVASSFAAASDVLRLHLTVREEASPPRMRALDRVCHAAKAAETGLLVAHCVRSGRAGRSLWSGRRGWQLAAGLGLSWAAAALAPAAKSLTAHDAGVRSRLKRRTLQAGLLGLAGAFLTRWAIVHAGQQAADDTAAARAAAQPSKSAPGWRPQPRR